MIFANQEVTQESSIEDVYVQSGIAVIWLSQASNYDGEDTIQIKSAADAEKLIETIRGMIQTTFAQQTTEPEAAQ